MKIIELCSNPTPQDAKMLKGTSGDFWRVDAGEYRIIYRLEDDVLKVPLIGKRNDDEVYREMRRRGL